MTWIVDPATRGVRQYAGPRKKIAASGSHTAGDISVSLPELFSVLD